MRNSEGIIDKERNPFICDSWIEQCYPFTDHRKAQLKGIIGLTEKEIRSRSRNEGSYVAFVAIRWSVGKMIDGRLTMIK